MRLRRWTPFVFLAPGRYVDRDPSWATFDIEAWSGEYDWTGDGWRGYRDFARTPRDTVAARRGDCEDYALVALAWLVANDRPATLAFCWRQPYPWPRHVVATDGERVYSSGRITRESLDEYRERDGYDWLVRRPVHRPRT